MITDPDDIRAWHRLDARTTTSGRLEAPDVDRLAALGVVQVINLALADHPEALSDEAERCAAAGIAYAHIPVPFDAPDEAHFAAFRAALDAAPDGPVHVHCIMNWRVSAFFYRLNRERGMAEADARALMERHWTPQTSDHPASSAWAAFVTRAQS
ncbi:sulfur transferase domain-containing protein [Novosphingobium sp. KCTC 2891]|uniref:beta-lactamase hydrolase domain-containing protein n=1 Tax=Novosphingobium sp. KCTC 2891 TaxID=2989730 RepID=UPI002222923A|nr:sulfur transferase domain-containing protein [Novosphingobium sp. KCTC 2891]MCW1383978.1 sulfur transferase domain-containing protein [Novosphingobium sp. KCTC 2891]